MKEKRAVKTGMKFVKTFAFVIPILLTENAKRIKAPHEANTESSIIGKNAAIETGVLMNMPEVSKKEHRQKQ